MEGLVQLCLGALCVFAPILLIILVGTVYGMGMGGIKLPGVARSQAQAGKDWTTVPELTRKITEGFAAVLSLIGALFGLLGFLLPWVSINVGAASALADLGGLNGTLSGIALAFQSLLGGFGVLTSDMDGAIGLGLLLLLISVVVGLIPIALLVTAALGAGLISIPLGLIKAQIPRLSRMLLIMALVSLCLACGFFAAVQATVGGVKLGASETVFGSSFSMGVEVANGFWITVGGLALALVGAIIANTMATRLANWAGNLASLERPAASEPSANSESQD